MKKFKYIFLLTASLFMVTSCDMDLLDDPNELTASDVDTDFLLNGVQIGFPEWLWTHGDYGMQLTRMINAADTRGSTYDAIFQDIDFDDAWENAYAGVLNDAKTLIPIAEEAQFFVHAGIARVLSAYVLMNMVDAYGDVPWTEALDPAIFNPALDNGQSVYVAAEALLNQAIVDFGKASLALPANDLYYGGDGAAWTKVARTMLLRIYITTRLVDNAAGNKINNLNVGQLIDDSAEDWIFPYGNNTINPDSRHPYFSDNYLTGASDYQSNYFMHMMYIDPGADPQAVDVVDPRIRYYLYRQTDVISTDVNEISCINENFPSHYPAGTPWCSVGNTYWGRDHNDTDGIPPDNLLRTNFGVYPAGGKFDDSNFSPVTGADGAAGAGIAPFWKAEWTHFVLAEHELVHNNDAAAARALLNQGIDMSIASVIAFSTPFVPAGAINVPSAAAIASYVTDIMGRYDAASNDADRLNVIITEFYKATYGNGNEAYNMYRRTGSPSPMQPALIKSPGQFWRSWKYPAVLVVRNANVNIKPDAQATRVFWDDGSASLL